METIIEIPPGTDLTKYRLQFEMRDASGNEIPYPIPAGNIFNQLKPYRAMGHKIELIPKPNK